MDKDNVDGENTRKPSKPGHQLFKAESSFSLNCHRDVAIWPIAFPDLDFRSRTYVLKELRSKRRDGFQYCDNTGIILFPFLLVQPIA